MSLGRELRTTGQRLLVYGSVGALAVIGAFLLAGFAVAFGIFLVGLAALLAALYGVATIARWRLGRRPSEAERGRIIEAEYRVVDDRREERERR